MIYTVFPLTNDEYDMPQDFPTYETAKSYAESKYEENEYKIESTEGEVVWIAGYVRKRYHNMMKS